MSQIPYLIWQTKNDKSNKNHEMFCWNKIGNSTYVNSFCITYVSSNNYATKGDVKIRYFAYVN